MVLDFCSKCEVLAMRRSERLLANFSLMLLASCCLVICTEQLREEADVEKFATTRNNRIYPESLLKSDAAFESRREAELLRSASELCARFPNECASVSDYFDGVSSQRSTGFTDMLAGRETPPWPSKSIHEWFKLKEARQILGATNDTTAASQAGNWKVGPGLGVRINQRVLRDPHRATSAIHFERLRQPWQQQRNMDQHIVEALPSAFSFAERQAPSETGQSGARSRSTRQQRSDDELQLSLPRRWVTLDGGPSEPLEGSQYTSTTSRHKIIQGGQKQEELLQCRVKQFKFTATKTDNEGNRCSGEVEASICYGGCDTGEIADWLFPGKKSIHKVCRHGRRLRRRALLNDCNSETIAFDNPLRVYHYVDAQDCVCKKCSSVDTTCLGTMSRPYLQTLQAASTEESGGDD